jgi:ABC-type uncharacterized transport system permease subunit
MNIYKGVGQTWSYQSLQRPVEKCIIIPADGVLLEIRNCCVLGKSKDYYRSVVVCLLDGAFVLWLIGY